MQPKYKGFLSLLGTSIIYGSFGVIVRAIGPYLTENQMTFARSMIVFCIIAIILYIKKISAVNISKNLIVPLIVHSVVFAAIIFLFTYAVVLTTLSKATFSFYATTLITSLIVSIVFFKEGFSKQKTVSLVLALAGLVFFILPKGIESIGLGMVLTGIAGIGDVVVNSMKKYLGGKINNLVLVMYQMLAGLIVGLILIIFTNQYTILQPFDLVGIVWLLFFSLNFFLLSYLTVYGFQHFDLSLGTIILSLELVWAALIGYFWFQEELNPFQITAMVLVTLSIVVINVSMKKAS
ncbi:MAG: DMT family transporter [bacterium]|nr:DMT family transporter [bacterium]